MDNNQRRLSEFTLKEIGNASGLDHPQKVQNGINYLVKNRYVGFLPGTIIQVYDGTMHEEFLQDASHILWDYMRMQQIISQINSLTQQ